jgi:hypothetical protein
MADYNITKDAANQIIARYQNDSKSGTIKGGKVPSDAVLSILNQKDCVALRYYFAQNDAGENTLVLVGEDSTGTLIVPGVMIDSLPPCPPYCPWNPLG